MAPKKNAREPTPSSVATTQAGPTAAGSVPPLPKPSLSKGGAENWDKVLQNLYNHYLNATPQRTKLIDVFLLFLVLAGGIQFLYCVLAGNYVRSTAGGIIENGVDICAAVQCFLVGLLGNGWTIRLDGIAADSDHRRKQDRLPFCFP